jgi:radical SAM superfamily enzyme
MTNNDSIYADSTPVRTHQVLGILDADKSPLDNFRIITHFVNLLPVGDKTEMLLTLAAFCRAELNG